ncbi:hypothetical protein BU23DRAFT_522499 [Bimuria novae-zelandiae CBS 107.79]|uniref:Zn(2)-C6 fungal-type domain-containing protein n=1 Tax=Bimuria novae-zelandiae CBS 107.79 TaxID=1447943 RepID=A0A6A5VXC7_9PLEO|nr:hypothetical protein BU23DRAFT_522499 [Bimuria novae-zelandiae CBS 107.79]
MVADSMRKRAKHTRSRRGCTVCRIRRIRCDETSPACNKCTSTGRKCEGLPQSALEWKAAHTLMQLILHRGSTNASSAEDRSFAYFRRHTSPHFAAPFGNEFWTCLVLQIAEREYSIKQAIIALGALHESFTDEHLPSHLQSTLPVGFLHKSNRSLSNLATASYTRALRGLNQYIVPQTYDGLHVALLCVILFTSFEWLRGSYAAATMHLKCGLNILRQWSSTTCTSPNTPTTHFVRSQIAPVFVRLSIQARTFTQDITPLPWLSTGFFAQSSSGDAQSKDQIRAARDALDVVCSEIYLRPSGFTLLSADCLLSGPSSSLPADDFTLCQHSSSEFSVRLAEWFAKYHMHLLLLPCPPQEAPRPENVSLTMWYTVLSLLQATSSTSDPMALDAYLTPFSHIVSLARLLMGASGMPALQACSQIPMESHDTPRFRIDMETVPMLYHVASKCRHQALRREAIALLRMGASREGLWDGWAVARLAEEIMTMEEEGLVGVEMCGPEVVPACQRVSRLIEETDLQTRTMRVRLKKWGEDDYGEWRMLAW